MITGVALSGGGAKGSFQVGALRYLYDHKFGTGDGLEALPTVICGTSVGAVNGAKLAEGGFVAFRALEKMWLGLRINDDMYLEHGWFKTLTKNVKNLLRKADELGPSDVLAFFVFHHVPGIDLDAMAQAAKEMEKAKALYHLEPIRKKMEAGGLDTEKVRQSKIRLRLAVVCLESGKLRYVTETGTLLERDNKTPVPWEAPPSRSGWIPQECETTRKKVQAKVKELQAAKAKEQELDAGKTSGGSTKPEIDKGWDEQIAAQWKQLHDCVFKHPYVPLSHGVLASSAIPAVFDPIHLLGKTYVDGGVREIVPIQTAIDCGAEKVYAIICSKAGLEDDNPGTNIPEIALRALNIALDEVLENETIRTERWKNREVIVIRPEFQVHDALTIDPGLIRINMAYGYMRASDVVASEEERKQIEERNRQLRAEGKLTIPIPWLGNRGEKSAAAIVRLWMGVHQSESRAVSPFTNFGDSSYFPTIRAQKRDLRKLVRARLKDGFAIPPGIEQAWMNWQHPVLSAKQGQVWPSPSIPIPAVCDPIRKQLQQKKIERSKLKSEPQNPQKGGSPDTLSEDIKFLDEQIEALELKLAECVKKNAVFVADPGSHGLLVRSLQTDVQFVIYGGSKLTLRGQDPFKEMGYDSTDVVEVSDSALSQLPTDRPGDGTLLRSQVNVVYVVRSGTRHAIRNESLYGKHGLSPFDVRVVPAETLAALPVGADLT